MLSKLRLLFWLNIILLFVPFFGLPELWKTSLIILIALVSIYLILGVKSNYQKTKSIPKSQKLEETF